VVVEVIVSSCILEHESIPISNLVRKRAKDLSASVPPKWLAVKIQLKIMIWIFGKPKATPNVMEVQLRYDLLRS